MSFLLSYRKPARPSSGSVVAHQSPTGSDAPVTLRWWRSLLPLLGTAEVSATRCGVGHDAHTLETTPEWATRIDSSGSGRRSADH